MTTVAEQLGIYAATLKYEGLPAEVILQTKNLITDTVGCAFGGYSSDTSQIARDLARTITSTEPATIFCSGERTSAELAAFANDVMIRYLDFNDGYISKGSGHPSDSIAALFAAAEIARAGGRELIVATVLAYEVFCRICDVWDNKPIGIDHVTIGGIASVVGVARLLGLTQPQIIEAINLTVSINIALNQPRIGNVSPWKACGYGNANRNAIFAAQLAARGMLGPGDVFEGRDGFFNVVARQQFKLEELGGAGYPFRIMRCHIKQFPLGNFSQTVVTAILEARKLVSDVNDIAEVHIRTSQKGLNIMADNPEKWRPRNRETADHSIPYTAAVALLFGTIDKSYFEEEYLHNKDLLNLLDRIKCSATQEANAQDAEINPCELELTLRSGERKAVRAEYHRGHWRNPMSQAEIEAKFRSLANDVLPTSRVDALLERLRNLEKESDIAALIRMTQINAA